MPRIVSRRAPVGKSLPVFDPTGSTSDSATPGQRPITPGISVSGSSGAPGPDTSIVASAAIPVLVLRIRSVLRPGSGRARPASKATRGSEADMLPQLTLQSIADLPAASWARVLSRSNPGRSEASRTNTLLLVVMPRPSPVI